MNVVIAGGGRTGATLASLLVAQNHSVRLIEHRPEVLYRIHRELPTEIIFEGDPTHPSVLEMAGVQKAHVLAACTPDDADNLVLAFFGRSRFGVPRTIARVNNPSNAWLFDKTFHVDVALNAADIMSSLIEEEMSLGDMMTLLKIRRGRFSIVEEKIPPGAKAVGLAIKDLPLPRNAVIAAIIRRGEIVIPRGVTQFEIGDEVLAIVDHEAADDLAALFTPPGGPPPRP
ncbi:MAG TPA: TrkA family potassium uptake protein [Anaerolineales bacterium]|nr:TrkA family potassium uptake protein [Anaerolineales bacterium]